MIRSKASIYNFWEWLLVPFIIGLMTVSYIEGASRIMVLFGFLFVFLYLFYSLVQNMINVPPEVIIFFGWIVWSLTGLSVATDRDLAIEQLKTVLQIGVLLFLISGITALRQSMSFPMLSIILGGCIVMLSAVYSGEYQEARVSQMAGDVRLEGQTDNANEFAYTMLFIVFGVFYFWGIKNSWQKYIVLPAFAVLPVIGIVYSGSRKGFLGLLAFFLLWWLFCFSKKAFKNPVKVIGVLLVFVVGSYLLFNFVMHNTNLGRRFERLEKEGDEIRSQMYVEGFDMIRKHPIFGVGMDNYRVFSSYGLYSHSDYIEVAANTGIVGFILYFSIYIVLWRRLSRIQKMTNDPFVFYVTGLLKAIVITILVIAFGRPNITSKETWILLGIAVGYSWSIENSLLKKINYRGMQKN